MKRVFFALETDWKLSLLAELKPRKIVIHSDEKKKTKQR